MQLLRESTPTARKDYRCNASRYVLEFCNQGIFTIAECREIVNAKRNGYKIKAGQQYIKQVQVDSRELIVYRAIPTMDALCQKYDLFPEW